MTIRAVIDQLTSGAMTFDTALAEFRSMRLPARQPPAPVDWTADADWPGDDDFFWIEGAALDGKITDGQCARIYAALQ